jgi:hypothetical protein
MKKIGLAQRFAEDERMRHAYAHLTKEFKTDSEWQSFLHAAMNARSDYSSQRAQLKQAERLASKIADTCARLGEYLCEFDSLSDVSELGPEEFVTPSGLIYEESYEAINALDRASINTLERHGWSICNEDGRNSPITPKPKRHRPPEANLLDVLFQSSRYHVLDSCLRPRTMDIIGSIGNAARCYTPRLMGAAGAATRSRKSTPKTQYLRSFWHLAEWGVASRLSKTSNLFKALAISATVAINDPDEDVSYDDVRKALEDRPAKPARNVPHKRKVGG